MDRRPGDEMATIFISLRFLLSGACLDKQSVLESGNLNKAVFPQEVSGGKARLRLSENATTGFGVELACVMQSPGQDLASGLPQGVRPYVVQTGMGAGTRLKFESCLHI
jgi:hypothetical protein